MVERSIQSHHILLVEDEEILANLLADKLQKAGFLVTLARDGQSGLDEIEKSKPDIVLLDILLPKKNGYQVLEELNQKGIVPDLPIIIISNSGQPAEVDRLLRLGVRDYLIKINFDPDEVLLKVQHILELAGQKNPSQADTASSLHADSYMHSPKLQASEKGGKKGIVMIVEDDIFIADLLGRKLYEQFEVHQASDTAQAEKILAETNIDVICLDILLPGKDGYSFLEELKKHPQYKDIPVLILSNLGQREEIERGLRTGATDYLIKANSSPEEILQRVTKLMPQQAAQ